MSLRLARSDIGALAHGCALLGSGGGGVTTQLELLAHQAVWPVDVQAVPDVEPATPCLAVGIAGSTMVITERLVDPEMIRTAIAAVERWLGHSVSTLCTIEIGGLNGFCAYIVGRGRTVLDADCMGRALPGIDQITLLAGGVPDLVIATTTGSGVGLVDGPRPEDAEAMVRAALRQSGGTAAIVIGGFTVGDLARNACLGTVSRALDLGREFLAAREAPMGELATAIGGRLLAQGRIQSVLTDPLAPQIQTYQLVEASGAVHRLVTGSETLAFMTDGQVISSAPAVLAVLDVRTRTILQIADLSPAHHVAIVELAAPSWWTERPERLRRVTPSAYGVTGLDARWGS